MAAVLLCANAYHALGCRVAAESLEIRCPTGPVPVQALVAWVAASGEPLGVADRAALAELVQSAAAARGAPLPGREQARARFRTGWVYPTHCCTCRSLCTVHGVSSMCFPH